MIPHRRPTPAALDLVDAVPPELRSEWHAFRQGLLMERERADLHAGGSGSPLGTPTATPRTGEGELVLETRVSADQASAGGLLDLEASWPAPAAGDLAGLTDGRPVRPRRLERLAAPGARHASLGAGALDLAGVLAGPRAPRWIELGDLLTGAEGRLWLDWLEALEKTRGLAPTPVRLRLDGPLAPGTRETLLELYEDRLCGLVFEPEAFLAAHLRAGGAPGPDDLDHGLAQLFEPLDGVPVEDASTGFARVLHGHLPASLVKAGRAEAFQRQSLHARQGGCGEKALTLYVALARGECTEKLFTEAAKAALSDVEAALEGRPGTGLGGAELVGRLAFWATESRPALHGSAGSLDLARIDSIVHRLAPSGAGRQAAELLAWFATAPDPQPALGQALDLVRRSVT